MGEDERTITAETDPDVPGTTDSTDAEPDAASTTDTEPEDEGSTLSDVLEYIAREIVDDPDAVEVTEEPDSRGVVLTLRVAKDDMGKVIGRGGRTARAIRTVVKAAGIRAGVRHTHVEIAD